MSKFIDQVKNMRVLLGSAVTLVVAVIFIMNYFTPAEAFREHVRGQELKELRGITIQYELNYKCYKETCQHRMANELYVEYMKMLAKIKKLEVKE